MYHKAFFKFWHSCSSVWKMFWSTKLKKKVGSAVKEIIRWSVKFWASATVKGVKGTLCCAVWQNIETNEHVSMIHHYKNVFKFVANIVEHHLKLHNNIWSILTGRSKFGYSWQLWFSLHIPSSASISAPVSVSRSAKHPQNSRVEHCIRWVFGMFQCAMKSEQMHPIDGCCSGVTAPKR